MSRMTTAGTTARKNKISPRSEAEPRINAAEHPYGSLEHILLVLSRLDSVYGHESTPSDAFATGEPLDGLMLTLLSQNTNDRNRDVAYGALRKKFPTWSDVARASKDEITLAIKYAGLGDIKAERMKAILAIIANDFGGYTLTRMREWDSDRVRAYLSNLRGIGPKTVACVMAFDLGLPAFPVDTHVARISRRLGWAGEKSTPEKIQIFLEKTVPPERCGGGHLNMIEHGRRICHARAPECSACVVADVCRERSKSEDDL